VGWAGNWNGTKPSLLRHPETRGYVFDVLAVELRALPDAVVMPLGQRAGEAVQELVGAGLVEEGRCCIGTPHPSPANGGMARQLDQRRAELSRRAAAWLGEPGAATGRKQPRRSGAARGRAEPLEDRIHDLGAAETET
jgi:hypothetical protein